MTLFPFVIFVFFFWLFCFFRFSLSLSHAYARCVCTSLSLVTTLEEQQPLSLARSQKIDRQREPKTHNRQTSEVAEKRKLKIFFYYKCAMCSRIIIEQRQEEQASEQGGGGGGVLVGRSVGLMFSWCSGTYELPTLMSLSFHLFFVAVFFFVFSVVEQFWFGFCRLFGHGRCVVCVVVVVVVVFVCVRACVFFSIECALLSCVSSHLALWFIIFRHKRRGLVGLKDSLPLVFFPSGSMSYYLSGMLFSLSLSLSRGLFSFLLCIYRGSDNCCCCCCCFFASPG
jgi:hypothetical protein